MTHVFGIDHMFMDVFLTVFRVTGTGQYRRDRKNPHNALVFTVNSHSTVFVQYFSVDTAIKYSPVYRDPSQSTRESAGFCLISRLCSQNLFLDFTEL